MSIELKQAAQQAVDAFDAFGDADDFASLFALTQKMNALRAALSQQPATDPQLTLLTNMLESAQAEAQRLQREVDRLQQPATPEPVAWMYVEGGEVMFGHPSGYRPADARPLVFGDTHPAPSLPADVVRDAERYRWLKARNNSAQTGVGRWESDDHFAWLCDLDADAAIDAAMLASQAQKGGE